MGSTAAEREMAYRLDEAAYGHDRTRQWHWYENEPRSRPHLPAYRITRNLITNSEYARFILETGHPAPDVSEAEWQSDKLVHPFARTRRHAWTAGRLPAGRGDHPVVLVSHGDALAYAAWLSAKTGQAWRLPREVEWERAARGTDGRAFPWGMRFDPNKLNSHDRGPFDTVPVASYPAAASPFGLLDAAGQVFEWTASASASGRYVVKGGSWDDRGCGICRPAARHSRPELLKHILVGFRLVRPAGSP
jgi:toxoflavin biosynthesis protein ToxD